MKSLPDDVLDFLEENRPDPDLKETDLTVFTAMEQWNCSKAKARAILEKAVKDGRMASEYRNKPTETGGKKIKIYILQENL